MTKSSKCKSYKLFHNFCFHINCGGNLGYPKIDSWLFILENDSCMNSSGGCLYFFFFCVYNLIFLNI